MTAKKDEPQYVDLPKTFVKIKDQKYAYAAENLVREDGWVKFTRINTKTGEKTRLEFREDAIESIETK